jgi:E3 ubiquitin-protein ligase MARCH6
MCLSMFIYVPLILAVVYVPGQVCLAILPNVFPFYLTDFSRSLVEVPFGNLLIVPLISLVHHARPGSILKGFIHLWIEFVGELLGIVHLVARDEVGDDEDIHEDHGHVEGGDNGPDEINYEADDDLGVFAPFEAEELDVDLHEENDRSGGVAAPAADGGDGDGHVTLPALDELERLYGADLVSPDVGMPQIQNVRFWAATMLVLAWITFVVGECIALTIPTVLGRALIRLIGLPSSHDLHSFGLGFYVLLAGLELAYRAHDFLSSVDFATAIRLALPYIFIVLKGLLQWVMWFGLAPLACGMLVELTVTVPLRVSHTESPYFYMYQDWALGLLLIKVWSKIADAGGFGVRWRERLERAREGGLLGAGQNFSRTLREVVGPILVCNVIALAIPYTLTRALLPFLGLSLKMSSFVYRYVYIWLLCIYLTNVIGRYTRAGLRALHDSIRDDKYLIGRRLYNYRSDAQ